MARFKLFPHKTSTLKTLKNNDNYPSVNEYSGFYTLYQINGGDPKNVTTQIESGRGKTEGLKSTIGTRGSICAHFGWTEKYVVWGIPFIRIQFMMVDQPVYVPNNDDGTISNDNQQPVENTPKNKQAQYKNFLNGLE